MGRVAPQRAVKVTNAQSNNGARAAKVQKNRKRHKVVLESADSNADEDKLRVVLSFHADPPPGYTFIPAGNTQLTAAMKDFAKRGGHKIMAVSATPHAARHELSREVHRIGYHFPTEVVAQVCAHYGIRLDSSGRLVGEQDSEKLFMKISQRGQVVLNETVRDQVTINTEAKEIIRDLFPRIPDNDLFSIIKTAFQLGQHKVGTADEIPLVRRAQLSVVAHIRHTYTNYDKLLRQVNYNDARHAVEKDTLMKLVQWRGDENDKSDESRKAVDDIVREVVVLSDEDESESELEEGQVVEDAGKIVKTKSKPRTPVLLTEHRPLSPAELSPDENAPQGYRFAPPAPRRQLMPQVQPDYVAQQQSRYAIWDQVRQEYHSNIPSQPPIQTITRIPIAESSNARQQPPIRETVRVQTQPVRYVLEDAGPVHFARPPSPPPVFRAADGRFYEKMPVRMVDESNIRRVYTPPTIQTIMPAQNNARRSASPRSIRSKHHRRTPSLNNDGTVVDSIESPNIHQSRGPIDVRMRQHIDPDSRVHQTRPVLIDLTSSAEKASRRRPISPDAMQVSYPEQPPSHAQLYGVVAPQPRRQLIELNDNVPMTRSAYRPEVHQPIITTHVQQSTRPPAREYVDEVIYRQDDGRLQMSYGAPAERRVVHEPVPDRHLVNQPVRYVVTEQPPMVYRDPNAAAYRANGNEQRYQLPPQPYMAEEPSRRIIVLDTEDPMEDVQRTTNSRYSNQYTTHVRI